MDNGNRNLTFDADLMLRLSQPARRLMNFLCGSDNRKKARVLHRAAEFSEQFREDTIRKWAIQHAFADISSKYPTLDLEEPHGAGIVG